MGRIKMPELNIVNDKMNTLDFAALTGTAHYDVLKKARKLLNDLGIDEGNFSAIYKDSMQREKPMLSLDRDLSLTLAGQYEPKIAYSVAKAFNSQPKLSQLEMLAQGFSKMAEIENNQKVTNTRLKAIEAKQHVIDRVVNEFTVMAYFVFAELGNIDIQAANTLGRKAAKYCRHHGYPIGKQPDPRFGKINAYPEHALITVLKQEGFIPE